MAFLIYKAAMIISPGFAWDQQKIASFFVMILIFFSITHSILNKNNITKFTIQLLTWCMIFLLVVIGYAFRFELNYVGQRVAAVLIPSYQFADKNGEIMVTRNNDGHFYIDALVNGVKIKFMIDTGASDIALTVQDAKKLSFDLSKLQYTRTYSTANGISQAAPVILDSLIIGNVFRNVDAHVGSLGLDISLLGMSMLERFKSFKIDKDMLILSY